MNILVLQNKLMIMKKKIKISLKSIQIKGVWILNLTQKKVKHSKNLYVLNHYMFQLLDQIILF